MKLMDVAGPNVANITASPLMVESKKFKLSLPHNMAANVAVWILFRVCPEALNDEVRSKVAEYDRQH